MKGTSSLARNARAPMIALITLSLLNLLNYVDRYVVSSLVPFLEKSIDQGGLALTHAQSGWLYSAFIVVYMIAAPAFGLIADRFPRLHVLAAAVAFWSVLTFLGGFANSGESAHDEKTPEAPRESTKKCEHAPKCNGRRKNMQARKSVGD